MDILTYLLQTPPTRREPHADLTSCPFTGHVDRALWAGFHADRLAYAFVGGYGAALARLVAGLPGRPFPLRMSMCATEKAGGHPKQIMTRLEERDGGFVINGEKTFATLASAAEELLVVANRGPGEDGRNRMAIVRVSPSARGVSVKDKPQLPFTPELPHAVVQLVDVKVTKDDVLPGDGYDTYLKPFRTIEDTHVLAATVGHMLGAARAYGFDASLVAELVALASSLVELGAREPSSPLTHVLLAGIHAAFHRVNVAAAPQWDNASPDERARWLRDQPILTVGDGIRAQRTLSAWQALGA